jgi:hypothetical protein
MPYCPNCRTEVGEGTQFCPKCGRGLTTKQSANRMSKKKKAGIIIGSIIGIPMLIIIIVAIVQVITAPTYTLSVTTCPSEVGSPSVDRYTSGTNVTVTANIPSGYSFDHWSGDASGTTLTITITMDSDKVVTANFNTTPASAEKRVEVFPNQVEVVDLDSPHLQLNAEVNSNQITTPNEKYAVQWFYGDILISTDAPLETAPFMTAIRNQEGTYLVTLVVWDKVTNTKVGEGNATVTVTKDKPIITSNHWVSTTPGKGMRYWTTYSNGYEWWEGDVDLLIQGSTGSFTYTGVSAAPHIPQQSSAIGQITVFSFNDWEDDGTNAVFTSRDVDGQVYTFELTHSPDNRLTGTIYAPEYDVPEGTSPGISLTCPEISGTLDLTRVP